jgi:aspartyl-tRNA synthetase
MLRTHTCGELRKSHLGKKVTLSGWADKVRAVGSKLTFLDLKDRYGTTQIILKGKSDIKLQYCVQVTGKVAKRKDSNNKLATGDIEIQAEKVEVLSKSKPLPFELLDENVDEELRLKYRYLDLRRSKIQKNLELRHKIINVMRDNLDKQHFIDISTPLLTKTTPEGARDYIVPSRVHPGKFYALPQSPQQYKQLIQVAGFDRYYQIAPCLRDENARHHRSPGEFYQLDFEMSFCEQEDILNILEKLFVEVVKKILPDKKLTFTKFPKLKYEEAIKKYKTDSPDLRKNKDNPNELAFCWIVDFPLFTPQSEEDFFHGAGKKWGPSHHMFTMPKESDLKYLTDKDAGKAKSYQHDLVLNGYEIGGGSIRIHKADIQEKIFDLIGFSKKQKQEFNHILEAFEYGVPPHGGIAIGIDRAIMVMLGEPNIREVIAFPKNKEARDVMMDAPSEVSEQQLKEAHIKLDKKK